MGRLAVLTAVAAASLSAAAGARGVTIPAAHVVVTLEPDGVVDMLEDVSLRTRAPLDARREVSMQQGELFAEPSVVVNGRRFRGGDGRTAGTFRLEWPQPRGRGSVRLGYRLALLGTAYADVAEVRVPIWERDWPAGPRLLTASARLPRAAHGRVYAWAEPTSVGAAVTASRRGARLTARDLPAGKRVTLHLVFPRSVLSSSAGMNVSRANGLQAILARRNGTGSPWWPWAVGAAAVLAVVSAVGLRTARRRRPRRR